MIKLLGIVWMLSSGQLLSAQWDIIVTLHDECVISKYYTHTLNNLHQEFSNEQFNWLGIFSFANADQAKMDAFQEKYKLTIPLRLDNTQVICSRYKLSITPEVVVIDQQTKEIMYRGRIDNAYARVGKKRPRPTIFNLQQALIALLEGELPIHQETDPIGCYITPL